MPDIITKVERGGTNFYALKTKEFSMLNAIIRFSLQRRALVMAVALLIMCYGSLQIIKLPIDVFPDLNRPRVVVMTEATGMAPEEVETLITFPLETALNGATGVQTVRSSSGPGISIVQVEFDWGTDLNVDRQVVTEKLAVAAERLPKGVRPQLTPISSIMGQIMIVGLWSENGATSPMRLRELADWVVSRRLQTISGVSQVIAMGGERKQFQVLVNPDDMRRFGVKLVEVETALEECNSNVTGGYVNSLGPNEYLVRALGRVRSIDDLRNVAVKIRDGRPVLMRQIANVAERGQVKRGDSSAFVREGNGFRGGEAVVLTINKQPGADTRQLTDRIVAALADLKSSLPADVEIAPNLYQQKQFIDLAVANVMAALRDGGILVAVILFLFLLNFRTTFITLTAIPLSIVVTGLIFKWMGMSINTMTLGGIAVAIGELVDDAIVDAENIFRRLRENRLLEKPRPAIAVVYDASSEIRNSIVYSTLIVVLAFIPLFALSGMEGRLFTPLGIAYVVSILASLVVSLTVTPALSYWLLPNAKAVGRERDSWLLRTLKAIAGKTISTSLQAPKPILIVAFAAVVACGFIVARMESDFMPPFDEGVAQLNILLPPGASLERSKEAARTVERRLQKIAGVREFVVRTGRAEMDEHVIGANMSEAIITFDPNSGRTREETLEEIREAMADIPGIVVSVEQPLAHLISAMISGVQAQVAIKIFGDDLDTLRQTAEKMKAAITGVPGIKDLMIEPQISIPQLRIEWNREQLARYGLRTGQVNEIIETAMQGKVVSAALVGERSFDILLRFEDAYRDKLENIRRMAIELPEGGFVPLSELAKVSEGAGPNGINREQVRRRIAIQCNVTGRGLTDVVRDIQAKLSPIQKTFPTGYFVEYGGQFQSRESASRLIAALFIFSLLGIFLALYAMFRSTNFALQVMVALPMAFIGAVVALIVTGQTLTIAAMIGFISLCGIAARNGILLLDHYVHLVREEGETWSHEMIIRAGKERLAPALMTALTAGIGLAPLAISAGEPGKEVLYPVATVIIGGLISGTALEFLVRPALFWTIGRKAGEVVIAGKNAEIIDLK